MYGIEGEKRRRRRLMRPVLASGAAATVAAAASHCFSPFPVAAPADSNHRSSYSFLKDGRKICVGDCALFLAGNSPPFVGIIRWFSPGKEDCLKLGVNWLYRPSDVKLAKGILLEAAPNEVFYSFHKDEISAESLLHPCKVAFLGKGVELPSGISSFVCRRVYDIANKCLWWLTDQDYINEHQEEVDQLIDKTGLEMHAAVQSGGRSPKPLNGPSTQQLKSGSDSVHNSALFSSQSKGKKKGEKGDPSSKSKREHSSNADDRETGDFRVDDTVKTEIAKITDKGGLINNDAVEKFVQLMQLDRGERKIDLAGRLLLVDAIAATSRNDCLGRFVQLRGVPVLDNWLQEAHRGKNGDGSPKEGGKSVEDLLLALLRALDKLPVNLNALQTCHIGKSVNHLRSHKNLEIQKKAKSLVDTWKKRVDAEMTRLEMTKLSDAKSIGSSHTVPWSGKPGLSEVSHGGNRRACSSEVAMKSSITQPSTYKSLPVKISHGDSTVKCNPASPGSLKWSTVLSTSVATGTKDSQYKAGGSTGDNELPLTTMKEEKDSTVCQPQNNIQPCSNDPAKAMGTSWKEDTRSSNASLINASKTSGGASHNRKSLNGLVGTGFSCVPDGGLGRSGSLSRNTTSDKVQQFGPAGERSTDVPVADHGNSHRLIVRLSNPGQSPAQGTNGGSFEDPLPSSVTSFFWTSEKNEHIDCKTKLKSDVCQANISADINMESWKIDDSKGLVGSDDGDRSPALLDEELGTVETGKEMVVVATSSEPELKPFQASSNSIHAPTEGCVKYSEAGASFCSGDDLGMNVLASVAAGEMSKSDLVSPSGSPGKNSVFEESCTMNEVKSKFSSDDIKIQVGQPVDNAEPGTEKCGSTAVSLQVQDEMQQNGTDHLTNSFADIKCVVPLEKTGEHMEQYPVSAAVSCKNVEHIAKSESKPVDVAPDGHVPLSTLPVDTEDRAQEVSARGLAEKQKANGPVTDALPDSKQKVRSPSSERSKSVDCSHENITESSLLLSDGNDVDHVSPGNGKSEKEYIEENPCSLVKQDVMDEGLHDAISTEQQLSSTVAVCPNDANGFVDNTMTAPVSVNYSEVDEPKKAKSDSMVTKRPLEPHDSIRKDHTNLAMPILDDRTGRSVLSTSNQSEHIERKVINHHSSGSTGPEEPPMLPTCESEQCAKSMGSKFSGAKVDMGNFTCSVEASSGVISRVQDTSAKCDFDLNEGFFGDEGHAAEPFIPSLQGCASAVHLQNPLLFAISPLSSGSSVPITVAAPARGPFVPPQALLKGKGEPGWKGSAATSAFRPAEPRKVLETPVCTSDILSSDSAAGKQSHLPLDIDLNVPDERVLEGVASQGCALEAGLVSGPTNKHDVPERSSGMLDLDLNRADESTQNGQGPASTSQSLGVPLLPMRLASEGFPLGEPNLSRDFDLNNGPSLDVGVERLPRGQHTKISNVPFLPSLRMNSNELRNLSSWLPPGNSYPAVTVPSFLSDRDQPFPIVAAPGTQRILGSSTGSGALGSDVYRGSVLTSSPAIAFPSTAAFSYPGFPFGSSFPLASTTFSGGLTTYVESASGGGPCFAAIPTPLMGTVGAAASPYVRPFVISLPDGSTGGGSESSWKWGQQGLDLNTGPGSMDVEGRDERLLLTSRQLSVASSQAFAEDQTRMYQSVGRGLKRKEPEGGRDAERLSRKPPSWQ